MLSLLFFPVITDAYSQQQDPTNNLQVGAVTPEDQYWQDVKFWIELAASVAAIIAGIITGIWAYTKYVLEKSLLPPVQFFVECKNLGIQGDKKLLEVLLHLKNLGSHTLVARNIRVDILYLNHSEESQKLELYKDPKKLGRVIFPHSVKKDVLELEDDIPPVKNEKGWEALELFKEKHRKKFNEIFEEKRSQNPNLSKKDLMEDIGEDLWKELWKDDTIWKDIAAKVKFFKKKGKVKDVSMKTGRKVAQEAENESVRGIPLLNYDTFVQGGVDQVYNFSTAVPATASYALIHASFKYAQKARATQNFIWFLSRRLGLIHYTLSHAKVPHTLELVVKLE
jgi:hypothetical protein